MASTFYWYHSNGDGTADRFEDSPDICARIDSGEGGWFGAPEGAIKHGGVIATAFIREVESVYDALLWLKTRKMAPTGEISTLIITAEPPTYAEDNRDLITGEVDQQDLLDGGDGIVYAGSATEAAEVRADLVAKGLPLHGVRQ